MTQALAAILFGPEDLRLLERDLGALAPGMVRVRFGAGGICGSDLHYFRHARTGDFVVSSPLTLGHEVAGEIIDLGDGAGGPATGGLRVGDRVAVNPSRWCGHCARCREGRPNLCENIFFMGSASKTPHMQGGFASVFDVTPAQCVKIQADVPIEAAALAEPLAVALHAVNRAGELGGKTVAIFGAGPIGLLILMVAKLKRCGTAAVADIAAAPLAFADRLGADHTFDVSAGEEGLKAWAAGTPLDVAFEVSGTASGLAAAIAAVRRGGTVVQVGNLPGGPLPVAFNSVMAKELEVRGSFRFGHEFEEAAGLISRGEVDVLALVTAERPLDQAADAFRLALDRSQSVKVLLRQGARR